MKELDEQIKKTVRLCLQRVWVEQYLSEIVGKKPREIRVLVLTMASTVKERSTI